MMSTILSGNRGVVKLRCLTYRNRVELVIILTYPIRWYTLPSRGILYLHVYPTYQGYPISPRIHRIGKVYSTGQGKWNSSRNRHQIMLKLLKVKPRFQMDVISEQPPYEKIYHFRPCQIKAIVAEKKKVESAKLNKSFNAEFFSKYQFK